MSQSIIDEAMGLAEIQSSISQALIFQDLEMRVGFIHIPGLFSDRRFRMPEGLAILQTANPLDSITFLLIFRRVFHHRSMIIHLLPAKPAQTQANLIQSPSRPSIREIPLSFQLFCGLPVSPYSSTILFLFCAIRFRNEH
jgi:hypothetical protein